MSGNASAMCWRRTRKQRKKRSLLRQIRALPTAAALLAEDETDLLLLPSLRAGWAGRGQTAPVPISGYNARRTIFGTLHLRTAHLLLMERERKRALEFQEFLDFIRWHYRAGPVALLLDEHHSHTDQESQSLAEDLDIRLLWLPNRSPQLNPLEPLWGSGKKEACANWQQCSIEVQVDLFIHYYQTLSRREVLRKAGLCSSQFWLHKVSHL